MSHNRSHNSPFSSTVTASSSTSTLIPEASSSSRPPPPKPSAEKITFLSLPHLPQLLILFLCRLVDFLQVSSLQAYIFYQLRSFSPSEPVSTISYQSGILQGCFTAAQIGTAILWGKVADAEWGGRKNVLLIALIGTGVSCLGFGFCGSFWEAALWRVFGGGINGSVGIIRTMISEITVEKKYQSRAFLLLPLSFNVASLIGPILGGLLADPVSNYPSIFGEGAMFGFKWLQDYPIALPNVVNASFLFLIASVVFLGLEETLKSRRDRFDLGLLIARRVGGIMRQKPSITGYQALSTETEVEMEGETTNLPDSDAKASKLRDEQPKPAKRKPSEIFPFRRLWTRNVIFTLITVGLFDFHMGAFNNLWALLLSSPRYDSTDSSEEHQVHLPFEFSGGLGMPASSVGFATAIIGLIGMILQFSLYPTISAKIGLMKSFRYSILLFPLAYFLAPYLSVLPTQSSPPAQADGLLVWIGLTFVLFLQVLARTFALPASIILINNCSPHPSVLGTIHGLGQSTSATARTIGPVVAGYWNGVGDEWGIVGVSWWAIAGLAVACCFTGVWVYEGSGHEILLPSETNDVESSRLSQDEAADLEDLEEIDSPKHLVNDSR